MSLYRVTHMTLLGLNTKGSGRGFEVTVRSCVLPTLPSVASTQFSMGWITKALNFCCCNKPEIFTTHYNVTIFRKYGGMQ